MNLSIKQTLLGSCVLVLCVAGLVGFVSFSGLRAVNEGAVNFNDNIVPGVEQAEELNVALGDLRISAGELLINPVPDQVKQSQGDIQDAEERLKSWGEKYEAMLPPAGGQGDDERATWFDFKAKIQTYEQMTDSLVQQVQAGQVDAARAFYIKDMDNLYTPMGTMVDKLVGTNVGDGKAVNAANTKTFATSNLIVVAALAALALVMGLMVFMIVFVLSRPMAAVIVSMEAVAKGNLKAQIPFTAKTNEIGVMARALEVFRQGLEEAESLRIAGAEQKARAEAERRAATLKLADDFERSVGSIVELVSAAATEMQAAAAQLSATAQESSAQTVAVSAAAEEAGANVTSVASSAEELGASVNEIGRQVEASASIAHDAVAEAKSAVEIVGELNAVASSIGGVLDLIAGLAGQTNLLALNATIESARAGEAGKGFAVVASEVKMLAGQTARATTEISAKIAQIQATTARAAATIQGIAGTIQTIDATSAAIAAAVDQQSSATQEIVQAVSQASIGTREVTSNISGVAVAAEQTGEAASQVLSSSSELAQQAERLHTEMDRFLVTVRAA